MKREYALSNEKYDVRQGRGEIRIFLTKPYSGAKSSIKACKGLSRASSDNGLELA